MGQPNPKLLCVDDDQPSLSVRQVFLEAFGFDVTICSSPKLSLHYADLTKYSAAILDFQMPEMNGGELAEKLRKRHPQMPIIILSALMVCPRERRRPTTPSFARWSQASHWSARFRN